MRTHTHRVTVIWLATVALLADTGGKSQAAFMFVSESAVFSPTTGEVQFTIEFNQPPDLFTLDLVGRQANLFQYFIVGDSSLPSHTHRTLPAAGKAERAGTKHLPALLDAAHFQA